MTLCKSILTADDTLIKSFARFAPKTSVLEFGTRRSWIYKGGAKSLGILFGGEGAEERGFKSMLLLLAGSSFPRFCYQSTKADVR